jgi:hypothetical protein
VSNLLKPYLTTFTVTCNQCAWREASGTRNGAWILRDHHLGTDPTHLTTLTKTTETPED